MSELRELPKENPGYATAAEPGPRSAARWLLLAPTLFLLVVVNQLDKTNIAVIIADHRFLAEMALVGQPARIGLLSTIFFFGYGIGLMFWGFVVDRLGPRRAAMIGVGGWALTTGWCALAHGSRELYLARFVLGLVEGCIWPVCNTYAGRWFPVREHGRIQSVWVNGNQVGLALGLPIVTVLITASGWRTVFWVLGAASLLVLEPMLFFLAPDGPEASRHANEEEKKYIARRRAGGDESPAGTPLKLRSLIASSGFWILVLCHTGTVATLFGLTTWIPTYLTQARGLPFRDLKGWVALSYALPIVVALALGWVADRSLRPALVGAGTSVMVAIMVFASVLVPSTVASVLLLVMTLAAPMIYGAMNASIIHELAMPEQIGRATGLFVGVGNLLGGLAPVILGYLIGIFHGHYLAAFGFVSLVNVAMAVFYFGIDRKPKLSTVDG